MVKKAVMLCLVGVLLVIFSQVVIAWPSCSASTPCGANLCSSYNSQYNTSACINGQCVPLLYSGNPCSSSFAAAIASPLFGTSSESAYSITIWTSQDAQCRYSAILQQEYANMIPFNITGGRIHSIISYSPVFDKTPFFTACQLSAGGISQARFDLLRDSSAASISARATPDVITDLPLATEIIVNSNEPVVCKYDPVRSTFDSMSAYLAGQSEENASSYSLEIHHRLEGLSDQMAYAVNISCKNYAGIISDTVRIAFSVNTVIEGQIVNITPSDGSTFSQSMLYIEAYTTRSSVCYYGNSTSASTLIDSTQGLHHKSNLLSMSPGKYSYYVVCSFKEGQQLKTVPMNFIIDLSPPLFVRINDSPDTGARYTYSLTSLSAEWEFNDSESDIVEYNYSVTEGYSTIVDWTDATTDSVKLNGLNLTNGRTYYFNVKAKNGAGMWSPVSKSLGITVDLTKSPVTCSNTIMDGNETDIDCGGKKCPVCGNGRMCEINSDCKSGYCNNNYVCSVPSCNDSIKNQDETDIDCGGRCAIKCSESEECRRDSDCKSQNCIKQICVGTQNTCVNGLLDTGETDVDCGGICASLKGLKCTIGKVCETSEDCMSGICGTSMTCAKAGDMDGDGVSDSIDNCPNIPNSKQEDQDNDQIGDVCDDDNDNDGLPDSYETSNGLDAYNPGDAALDNDNDGLTNIEEFKLGTGLGNADSDGDGYSDKAEVDAGTSPTDSESKPTSKTSVFIIAGIALVVVIALFIFIYYKKAIAPAKIKPVSRMSFSEMSQWTPQAVEPEQHKGMSVNRHNAFEAKHQKKISGMKTIFREFDGAQPVRKVEPPPATDNIFDKFAEIPVKNGEQAFGEMKKKTDEGKNGQ
jgi:hypothetical protein